MTSADTAAGSHAFLSTVRTGSPDQIGLLTDFAANDRVYVRPLSAAWSALPAAGQYRVETDSPEETDQFLNLLLDRLNTRLSGQGQVDREQLLVSSQTAGTLSNVNVALILGLAQGLIVALVVLLLVYHLLHEAKQVGVLKLHGFSSLRVWWRMVGRLVLGIGTGSLLLAAVASRLIPGADMRFAADVCIALTWAFAGMLLASLVTTLYTTQIRPSDSLKNRKDTTGLFVVNCLVRGVATVGVLVIGASLLMQYRSSATAVAGIDDWAATKQYGIFVPVDIGNDLEEDQTGGTGSLSAKVFELYPALNGQGGLFVDATSFQPGVTGPDDLPTLVVNPHYLAAYSILGLDGQPISVAESTTDWVVLAPTSMKGQATELQEYFERKRHGDDTHQGIVQGDQTMFGRPAPATVREQQVRIVWVPDGQRVFAFDPTVAAGSAGRLDSPLVEVMTLANSVGGDRLNMITLGPIRR